MSRHSSTMFAMLTAGALLAGVGLLPPSSAAAQESRVEKVPAALLDLSRQQLAGLFQALAGTHSEPPPCVADEEMFDDVPATNPFCPWIEEMARRGITGGCGGGNFCPGDPVSRSQMAVFVVRATAAEASHIVGAPGEPEFGDGGDGDCLWTNLSIEQYPDLSPVSFFKGPDGVVHLAGNAAAVAGPDGDMSCSGGVEDLVVFELPAGYQPKQLEYFTVNFIPILIAPEGGVTLDGTFLPGGSVIGFSGGTPLNGITFRAAPATATPREPHPPASVSLEALRALAAGR